MRPRDSTSGFTLIEVLIAFTIAAILLLPLLRSFSSGIASAGRTNGVTEATLIAESTLETMGPGVALTDGGRLDQEEGRYRIVASVHRYGGDSVPGDALLPAIPYEVLVTVSWQEAARTRSVALRTLRLGPLPATEQTQ